MATLNEYRDELRQTFFEEVADYIEEDNTECFESVFENLEDSVTGNDNGSYYCNRECARTALLGIVCDVEFLNLLSDYGEFYEDFFFDYLAATDFEAADVVARYLILDSMYPSLEDEYYRNYVVEEDEDDEE